MAENDDDLGIDTSTGANPAAPAAAAKAADKADEAPAAWVPPTKEQFEKLQRDLATANQESKARREKLQELQRATEDADGKAARERAEAAEAKYKPIAVKAAAKAAFLEAGLAAVTPEKLGKLTRLLDLDSITISDDGDVVGLTSQVNTLKAEFPEMFGGAGQRQRAPRLDAGDRRPANAAPKSSAEILAASIMGGSG